MPFSFEGNTYFKDRPVIRAHHLVQIYNASGYLEDDGFHCTADGILNNDGKLINDQEIPGVLEAIQSDYKLYRVMRSLDAEEEEDSLASLGVDSPHSTIRYYYQKYIQQKHGIDLLGLRNTVFLIARFEREQFDQFRDLEDDLGRWADIKQKLFPSEREKMLYDYYFKAIQQRFALPDEAEFVALLKDAEKLKEIKSVIATDPFFGANYYRDHYEPSEDDTDYKHSLEESIAAESEVLLNWLNSPPETEIRVTVNECDFCNARVYGLSCKVQDPPKKRMVSRDSVSMARFVYALRALSVDGAIPTYLTRGQVIETEVKLGDVVYPVRLENKPNQIAYTLATDITLPIGLLRRLILEERKML